MTASLANVGLTAMTRPDVHGTELAETAVVVHGFSYDMPKTRRS